MLKYLTNDRLYSIVMWVLFSIVGLLIITTFRDYGITWDEEYQSQYGLAVIDYYTSFFKDQRYSEIFNLYLYGGMFDGLASLIDRYTPFSVYETRHLLNATFGLLGLIGTWRLTKFIGSNIAGILAVIFLVLTPLYYGHMFNNPKDIPFAVGIIWTLFFMARCYASGPAPKISLILRLGIVLGLTLGIRVGGVMIFLFWLAPIGTTLIAPLLSHRYSLEKLKLTLHTARLYVFRMILPVGIISYLVMLICWPWAQQNPILNPLRALSEFSNFPQNVEVLLDGKTYMSTELPWYYVPVYFGIQLPELVLLLFITALLIFPLLIKSKNTGQKQTASLILLMGIVPVSYAMIRHPALYDAARHFLFVIPIICIMAAICADYLYTTASSLHCRYQPVRKFILVGMIFALVLHIITQIDIMKRLHPYEYIYANSLTGGVAGAYGKYELDYWGMSFKEAADKIQDVVAREGGVPAGKIYKVAICGPWDAAMIYMPPDYEAVEAADPAEFFLSTTRWMCQDMREGKEIIRIKRFGVPLSIVKDLRISRQ